VALRDILVHFGIEVDQSKLQDAQRNVNALVVSLNQLQRIAGFAVAALGVGSIIEASDAYTNLANRLRAVTDSTHEFITAENGVFDIARKTFTEVDGVAAVFQRFSLVTEHLGKSQAEVLDFTQQITMAMRLGGSTAQEAKAALIQFGQGLGNDFKSGGQELNSIIEQAPELAKILAKAAGGTLPQLKKLAKEGKLSADVIFKAMAEAQPEIEKRFAERARTFEDLRVAFGIEWLKFMKDLEGPKKRILELLLKLATATREWVESGEAMNSFIAAAIVGVGTLSVVMGTLLLKVALVTAGFTLLFLAVEDFVAFLRGDGSVLGDWLDSLDSVDAKTAREAIKLLWEDIKKVAKWIADPANWNWEALGAGLARVVLKFGDTIKNMLRDVMLAMSDLLAKDPAFGPVVWALKKMAPDQQGDRGGPVGPQRTVAGSPQDRAQFEKDNPVTSWFAKMITPQSILDDIDRRTRERTAAMNGEEYPGMQLPTFPTGMGPIKPELSPGAVRGFRGLVPSPAPTINNNITVQGNATPSTAREVAAKAGTATAASLGRDRSATGAAFGVGQ
jgi:tape measure domain-containing protein